MEKPSYFFADPEALDAWLREEFPDDVRLKFYQWIGAQAVTEAVAVVQDDLRNDPREAHAQHYHRDEVEELFELLNPKENLFPSVLPLGRPFCDVNHHTHTNGDGRLPTCRLDSPE